MNQKKALKLKQKNQKLISDMGLDHKWKEVVECIDADPTRGQFTKWMLAQIKKGYNPNDIIPTVEYYHKNIKAFKFDNINQYDNLKELEDEVKSIDSAKAEKKETMTVSDSERTPIWNQDPWFLIRINSRRAAQKYGAGSRWCITMSGANFYATYTANNIVFYFLINKTSNNKYAFAVHRGMDNKVIKTEIFDVEDKVVDNAPFYSKYVRQMQQDAEAQPMAELAKAKNGIANKQEIGKLLSIYHEDYEQAKQSGVEDRVSNALDAIDNLEHVLSDYPRTVFLYSKQWPEMLNAVNIKNAPPEILEHMVYSKDSSVRRHLAEHTSNKSILEKLSNDNNLQVLQAVINNRFVTANVLDNIANICLKNSQYTYLAAVIASKEITSPKTLEKLFFQLPKDGVDEISRALFMQGLAKNENTPDKVLKIIFENGSADLKYDILSNNNIPPEVVRKIFENPGLIVPIGRRIGVPQWMSHNVEQIYMKLIFNTNTPGDILQRIFDIYTTQEGIDEYDYDTVCRALAKHSNTPIDVLEKLSRYHGELVKNPNATPEMLDRIADIYVKEEESDDPYLITEKEYNEYSNYDDWESKQEILRAIVSHPNVSVTTLEKLANDYRVLTDVLRNPKTPTHIKDRYHIDHARINTSLPPELDIPWLSEKRPQPMTEGYIERLPKSSTISRDHLENVYIANSQRISNEIIMQLLALNDDEINTALLNNSSVPEAIKQKLRSEEYGKKYEDLKVAQYADIFFKAACLN